MTQGKNRKIRKEDKREQGSSYKVAAMARDDSGSDEGKDEIEII